MRRHLAPLLLLTALACADDAPPAGMSAQDMPADMTLDMSSDMSSDMPSDMPSEGPFPTGSTCRTPAGVTGAPCAESEDCGPNAWCDAGACAPAAGRGEPCSDGVFCAEGLACAFPDTVCGDVPGQGDACALTRFGPFGCPEGLGCSGGTCGPLPGAEAPCTMDNRCQPGLGCDFTANGSVCRAPRGAGEPCENDQICAAGLFCDYGAGRCAALYALGASCTLGNECGPQADCLPADPARLTFRCYPLPGLDQPCLAQCADALVCAKVP